MSNSIITSKNIFDNKCSGIPIINGGGNLRWPENDTSCVGSFGDPKLDSLSDHDSLMPTLGLMEGSAAIDAGVDSICAADPVSNTSQNGVNRPFGPHCDIGASELDYLVVSSIKLVGSSPTNLETVQFSVTFSKPVTGVDKSDFSLVTTGISSATISTITGSGANYIISVNTGSNSGILQLVLHDNDSIQEADGSFLGTAGLGNGDYLVGESYIVDKQLPQVFSINRVNSNPISSPSVAFEITFSEPIMGIDLNDFRLSTIGLINAEILELLGADNTYTVIVDTGIGDGTLGLELIDNGSIFDAASNQLGGGGNDNGNFVDGEYYTIKANASFVDVPTNFWAYAWIERLFDTGVTTGCSQTPPSYCPDQSVTRAEMAIFLERSKGIFIPPNVNQSTFSDVAITDWHVDWIELLFADGITTGCDANPLKFCPNSPVTRAEMAVFIIRTKFGVDFEPDPAKGYFSDVDRDKYWAADYIEQLYQEGITTGCATNPLRYCPDRSVTRAEMAAFLLRAFDLD
jgi:hypothetical protein